MSEWKECKFEEFYLEPSKNGLSKPSKIRGSGYKMINMGELFSNDFIRDIDMELVPLTDKEKKSGKIEVNDLLFARQSLTLEGAGKCSIVIETSPLTVFESHLIRVRLNQKLASPIFFYYYFKSKTNPIKNIVTQAVQAGIKASELATVKVRIPSLSEQKKIAAILSSLDEKIETNRKINARLEELAQALFKSWFIDFEPFGGKMPEDWKKGVLSDELRLEKNAIKASDVGNLPYLPIDSIPMNHLGIEDYDKSENAQSSLITFSKNDILIGAMRVYFHRVILSPFDGVTRTTCFVLKPNKGIALPYLLLLCNQDSTIEYANSTSKGTTMPYAIWENGLGNMEIRIPSLDVLKKFYNVVMPLITKIRDSYKERRSIVSLRDTLLPKLMSGELIPE